MSESIVVLGAWAVAGCVLVMVGAPMALIATPARRAGRGGSERRVAVGVGDEIDAEARGRRSASSERGVLGPRSRSSRLTALGLSVAATAGPGLVMLCGALALGGAGVLAWLWVGALLAAPLRWAECWLARAAPPGQSVGAGSLSVRAALHRPAMGLALGGALSMSAALWWAAQADAADDLLALAIPSMPRGVLLAATPLLAALTIALAPRDPAAVVGAIAISALALLALGAAAMLALDPGAALAALGDAIAGAMSGAASVGAWSGASAREVAAAAWAVLLPSLLAMTGLDGALHASARAELTREQAGLAWWTPIAHALLLTIVGIGVLASGALSSRLEGERPLAEVTFWRDGFRTASQRAEIESAFDGIVRVIDGQARARPLEVATERGSIVAACYRDRSRPADFAAQIRVGRVVTLLEPDELGVLREVELARAREITVTGRMLPTGARLLEAAARRAGPPVAVAVMLAAYVLLVLGAAGWGLALGRITHGRTISIALSLTPAIALAAGALLDRHRVELSAAASIGVAASAALATLFIGTRYRELASRR